MSEKLKTKDLVTIGVFFVIYYVLYLASGIIALIPILLLAWPASNALVNGVTSMLFMAKVQKPFAFFIFGILPAVVNVFLGYHFIVLVIVLIFMLLAEFVVRKGEYKTFKYNAIAYGIFSASGAASLMQIVLVHEHYIGLMKRSKMPDETIRLIEKYASWSSIAIIMIATFMVALIGALIGRKMLKKHFEKAGII